MMNPFERTLRPGAKLRLLKEEDAAELFALTDQNRKRLRQWLGWVDGTREEKDTLAYIRFVAEAHQKGIGMAAGILLDDRLVGVAGLHELNRTHSRVCVGYWIGEEASGKGLITDATRALCLHAFDDLELHRVEIRCATGNLRSQKVPERLGFQFEGISRECEWLYDRFVDHKVYSLLKDEADPLRDH